MRRAELDLSDLLRAEDSIKDGAERGLRLGLEHLLTEANRDVPHDEGTLERSGSTDHDGLRGSVYYDTPYAARQHEDLTLNHDGKGKAKWLEGAFTRGASTVAGIIRQAIKREART